MAILRAPSQFSPAAAGGPVTPSCCGCSCCCCCVGSAVATSVALPMVLHQITRARPAGPPGPDPTGVADDQGTTAERRVGLGRRVAGIALAALTIPAVVAVAIVMHQLGDLAFIAAVTVAIVLGVGSYLLAGSNTVSSMVTPLVIMLIGSAMTFGELFLWIVLFIDDESSKAAKTAAGVAIPAIPVITTILLALAGRHRRKRRQRA